MYKKQREKMRGCEEWRRLGQGINKEKNYEWRAKKGDKWSGKKEKIKEGKEREIWDGRRMYRRILGSERRKREIRRKGGMGKVGEGKKTTEKVEK